MPVAMQDSPSAHTAQMDVFHDLLHLAEHPPVGAGGQYTAIANGSWFDPATWEGGIVPATTNAFVLIPTGIEVVYDGVATTPLAMVRVDGALTFATDQDTQLVVDTMMVNAGGALTIGTPGQPVAAHVKADIVFHDSQLIDRIDHTAGDIDNDPTQLSLGLISHGTVNIHGAEKTSHLKVATDPMQNATSISLIKVPTGWQVGDTILVTGTHFERPPAAINPLDVAGTYATQDEQFTIVAINGNQITLSGALRFDHDTPDPDFKASVANLTRNVEFRSADPSQLETRGHTMFMHVNTVEIHNAAFTDLGRTDKSRDVDDYVLAGDGTGEDFRARADGREVFIKTDAADVENMRGRYALHLHSTGTEVDSRSVTLEGNVVSGTPGWGIVQHDSSAVLRENVAHANFGAGIVAETGNETGAWVRNLTVQTAGRPVNTEDEGDIVLEKDQGRNQDFGVTGTGFWFQGRILAALDNVAASSTGAGYFFLHRGVDDIETDADTLQRPEIANGEGSIASNRPAIEMFVGNESYAGRVGLIIIGDEAPRLFNDDRSVIDGFDAWEFGDHGVHIQYSAHYTLTNMRLYGTTQDTRDLSMGIKLGTSLEDVVVHNTLIANVPMGIYTRDNFTDATQISFWGKVDQPTVDRITDYGHRFVDVEFVNVDERFDGRKAIKGQIFKATRKVVIDGDNLPNLALDLRLDDASLTTAWGSMGGHDLNGAWLTGTKTDSLGTIAFPAYSEKIYISQAAIDGLLTEFGYFTVGDRKVILLDTLYSDRLTGANDILTHTLEIAADWVLPAGARDLGALPDITAAEYFHLFFRGNNPVIRTLLENEVHFAAGLRDASQADTVMVRGSALKDTLVGDAAPNLLLGNGGNDSLSGGLGRDTLIGGEGNDVIDGGDGDDRLYADDGFDVITGGEGNDIVAGDRGNDTLLGNAGDDTILGGDGQDLLTGDDSTIIGGNDSLSGGMGDDTLDGAAASDTLSGGEGSDTLFGATGNDLITAGTENDALFGGNGNDSLAGEEGEDTLDGGVGDDRLDGGLGARDQASFISATAGVMASLLTGVATGQGNDTLLGIERLVGSRFRDQLTGDALHNELVGGDGDDWLEGGLGNDQLDGGAGFDVASYATAEAAVLATLANPNTQVATRAAGMDTLAGMEGLEGSAYNDTLTGNADANLLAGGGGNDRLNSGGGADTLDGGAGYDTADFSLVAGPLAFHQTTSGVGGFSGGGVLRDIEEIWGTDRGDTFTSDAGAHNFEGEGGDDTVMGGGGADTLEGLDGLDTLSFAGTAGANVAIGSRTATVTGIAGTATVSGFEVLIGSAFADTLAGGSASETIRGGAGQDNVVGGAGDDLLEGEDGDDVLNGGEGSDTIDGGTGFDRVVFTGATSGLVLSLAAAGAQATAIGPTTLRSIEAITGTSREDNLGGNAEANLLDGAGGNDALAGAGGNDTLLGGSGLDLVEGGAGQDIVRGDDGDDTLLGGEGNDLIDGGEGVRDVASYADATAGVAVSLLTNRATGAAGADTLAGIEVLEGSAHDDTFTGGISNDTLRGAGGNDLLDGGVGNDVLDGGEGIDTASYLGSTVGVSVSLATVTAQNTRGGGTDTLVSIEALIGSAQDDTLAGSAADNTLRGGLGDDLLEGGGGADLLDGGEGFDTVTLGNTPVVATLGTAGATIAALTLLSIEALQAGNGNDSLASDGGSHALDGGAGNDTLNGGAGQDTLVGGDGLDFASYDTAASAVVVSLALRDAQATAGAGTDLLAGIEGLIGSAHDDTLTGGAGSDTLRGGIGQDSLAGGAGNDRLEGGDGNDLLHGGSGDDTVLGGIGSDTLAFTGIAAGVNVSLAITGRAQTTGGAGALWIEGVEALLGTAKDDRLTGDAGANTLEGAAGDDTLDGGAGADLLIGGDGIDVVSFAAAISGVEASLLTNRATGGGGNDSLAGIEVLEGSSFDDTLTGDEGSDTVRGGAGNDVLGGSVGNDLLDGGAGIDLASYFDATAGISVSLATVTAQNTRGAGTDVLLGIEQLDGSIHDDTLTGAAGAETLRGGAGNDRLDGGLGADRLEGGLGFDLATYAAANGGVTVALAADGSGVVTGAAGFDTLAGFEAVVGSNFADLLASDAGAHRLEGGGGNDTFLGGLGNDTIDGGDGIDTASYAGATIAVTVSLADRDAQATGGGGTDTLAEVEVLIGSVHADWLGGDSGANTLRGGAGADTLWGGAGNDSLDGGDGDDLLIGAADGVDTLLGGTGFDTASFAGAAVGVNVALVSGTQTIATGRTLQLAEIEGLLGSSRDDVLTGSALDNALSGGGGNDTVSGSGGNDTLAGGLGVDSLTGGSGADLFRFEAGDGSDTVTDFGVGDRLHLVGFGNALDTFAEVMSTARQNGADTQLRLANLDGGQTTINLVGTTLSSLDASDFLFS